MGKKAKTTKDEKLHQQRGRNQAATKEINSSVIDRRRCGRCGNGSGCVRVVGWWRCCGWEKINATTQLFGVCSNDASKNRINDIPETYRHSTIDCDGVAWIRW